MDENDTPVEEQYTSSAPQGVMDGPFRMKDMSRAGIEGVDFCDVPIDNVSLDRALRSICIRVAQQQPGFIATPNVDHLCLLHRDLQFRKVYNEAFLSLLDSKPMFWAGRLLGIKFRAKLSGSDMIYHVTSCAREKGWSIFLLGAADGVAEQAAEKLVREYPGLKIAGTYGPPLHFEKTAAENDEVLRRLKEAQPDICFVAIGSPRQEFWMLDNYHEAGVPVMIGVGAAFDFVAGRVRRAPVLVQRVGMEWLWRLCGEPRRLWRRYLVNDALFFPLVAKAVIAHVKDVLTHRPPQLRNAR